MYVMQHAKAEVVSRKKYYALLCIIMQHSLYIRCAAIIQKDLDSIMTHW